MSEPLFPFFDALVLRVASKFVWRVAYTDAPDTLEKSTLHYMARAIVLEDGNNSDTSIFGSAHVNHAFRAWHDFTHIRLQAPFTREGEERVCRAQQRDVANMPPTGTYHFPLATRILECEVIGQFDYQAATGQFPVDQRAFTVDYFNKRGWSLSP